MDIRRVDDYDDPRFSREVLLQHGAFLMDDDVPIAFRIIAPDTAEIATDLPIDPGPVIDEFRFYAEHITRFVDADGRLIAAFPPVRLRDMPLMDIQPSQFFVDARKLEAVAAFIHRWEDIVVPVNRDRGKKRVVSLDGHTRLYLAFRRGWRTVRAFDAQENADTLEFADEAQRRGVNRVGDMRLLSHAEYEVQWNRFCDEWFARRRT